MNFSRGLIVLICGIGLSCDATPDVTAPCPRPAFTLTPPLDTIGVGVSVRYEVLFPAEQQGVERRLYWISSDVRKASVDQSGLAVAHATGTVQIVAIDRNTPATCPDQWYGTLVVE